MDRRQLLTAGIGVLGVLFSLVAVQSDLPGGDRFLLGLLGAVVFLWAALSLYSEWRAGERRAEDDAPWKTSPALGRRITKIDLINEEGDVAASWDIYEKTSAVIGRDYKENQVDIDLGRSEYASLVDIHHAVLNYAGGDWYIEDLGSKNGVLVQKAADGRKYRLSPDQPCKLRSGDVIIIGMSRLRLH